METDVLIIGMGPAGLQAAIHAARKKVRVTVVGKESGSALVGTHIENYFGTPGVIGGEQLLSNGVKQAESFGAVMVRQNVSSLMKDGDGFKAVLESGDTVSCRAIILATGISRKKLGVPGEKEFLGKGVSYCASCDCNFYKGVPVMIVGNESEAAESAVLMTKYASEVYWSAEKADIDASLAAKVKDAGVRMLEGFPAEILAEDGKVSSAVMKDGRGVAVRGVFIELGGRSSADLAMGLDIMPEMDDTIKVDRNCKTELDGVYACGDVTGRPWQVAKAVGEGNIAGMAAAEKVKK